jgi:hypothetical protein
VGKGANTMAAIVQVFNGSQMNEFSQTCQVLNRDHIWAIVCQTWQVF